MKQSKRTFLEEFRAFAMRGNVVDLAVAVVIGAAFGKIVSSLVDNIVMPLVGLLLGGVNFSSLSFEVGGAVVGYGVFIQNVIDFLIIALAIFVAIKIMNSLKEQEENAGDTKKVPEKRSKEEQLLTEIRDLLKKS